MDEQEKAEAKKHASRAASQAKHAAKNTARAVEAGVDAVTDPIEERVEDGVKIVTRDISSMASLTKGVFGLLIAGAVAYVSVKELKTGRTPTLEQKLDTLAK